MKWALIIGNSQYQDSKLSRLTAPSQDVNELQKLLRAKEIGNFEVEVLENESHARVSLAIARLFAQRRSDDTLLLYFSGHGVRDDNGRLFLAVKDTDQEYLRQTAISSAMIKDEMDQCASKTQILILDCCHSGAFGEGSKSALNASVGTKSAFEGNGSGRVILTATDSLQFAWEGDRVMGETQNSLFTHFLIQGLKTGAADLDNDGIITLEELYRYTYDNIRDKTTKQTPQKWNIRQQGDILLARNPNPVVKPVPLPADLILALASSYQNILIGAFNELESMARGSQGKGLALSALQMLKEMANDDSRRKADLAREALRRLGDISPGAPGEDKPNVPIPVPLPKPRVIDRKPDQPVPHPEPRSNPAKPAVGKILFYVFGAFAALLLIFFLLKAFEEGVGKPTPRPRPKVSEKAIPRDKPSTPGGQKPVVTDPRQDAEPKEEAEPKKDAQPKQEAKPKPEAEPSKNGAKSPSKEPPAPAEKPTLSEKPPSGE